MRRVLTRPPRQGPDEAMAGARRRLFFALWPDDRVRAAIAAAASDRISSANARLVPREKLHITLVFLGAIDCAVVPVIAEAARKVHGTPFALELERIGYWHRSRIAWLAPPSPPPEITRLAGRLHDAVSAIGLALDRRRYCPHVTLARRCAPVAHATITPITWELNEFVLVESHTGSSGSRYEVIERYCLS